MHRYDCKVRLAGQLHNEVRKFNCSAAEILCLRAIHGDDSVVEIQRRKSDRSSHDLERNYLEETYGTGLRGARTSMAQMFGPRHQELPNKLPNYVYDEGDDEDAQPKKQGRKKADPMAAPAEQPEIGPDQIVE